MSIFVELADPIHLFSKNGPAATTLNVKSCKYFFFFGQKELSGLRGNIIVFSGISYFPEFRCQLSEGKQMGEIPRMSARAHALFHDWNSQW